MKPNLHPPQRRTDGATGPTRVPRYDRAAAHLLPADRTRQGYIRGHAAIAVPGVLEYEDIDGNITRELITAEELHNTDSLRTLASMPVTLQHPDADVTPDTVGAVGIGDVGEDVEILEDTGHVRIGYVIRRRDGVDAVDQGLREVSPGYSTVLDPTPGNHPVFGPYDAVQTQRRYNHLAVVDEARGGNTVRLRADGAKRLITRLDSPSMAPSPTPIPPPGDHMHPSLLTIAALCGLSYTQDKKDGKVYRTDMEGEAAPEEVGEGKLVGAIAQAIKGLQDAIEEPAAAGAAAAPSAEASALREQLAQAVADQAELQGKIDVLEKEKSDADEAEAAKADAADRTRLDALAARLGFKTDAWKPDTTVEARKLDLVRHDGVVAHDETPDPARVNGMIDYLASKKLDSKSADAGPWAGFNRDAPVDPPKRTDSRGPEGREDTCAADPFNAAIAKRRAAQNA